MITHVYVYIYTQFEIRTLIEHEILFSTTITIKISIGAVCESVTTANCLIFVSHSPFESKIEIIWLSYGAVSL